MRPLKHLCKLNKEVTNELCDEMGVEREQLFKILNREEFKRMVREAVEKEAKNFLGRRSFLEALALGAGITIGSMGLAKGDVLITNDNVIVKDPSTGLDWDLRVPMPFSAIVGIEGSKVRAYDWRGRLIDSGKKGVDDTRVIQSGINATPDYGCIRLLGEFIITKNYITVGNRIYKGNIVIRKPLTIVGGRFIRDTNIGSDPHTLFIVGYTKDEPIMQGVVKFIGCVFDGNERNITQTYSENAGAPVHLGITIKRVEKVEISSCLFKDMAREAIWLPTISTQAGVIDHSEIIITNNYFENVAYAVTAESYEKLVITNNIVKGINANGDPINNRSYFVSPNYLDCYETIISNNIIDGMVPDGYPYAGTIGKYGISQGGNTTTKNLVIKGNTIKNVRIGISVANAVISSNTISDIYIGFDLYAAKNNIVTENTIRRFEFRGINMVGVLGNNAEKNIIASNTIDAEDKTPDCGIYIWDFAIYNVVVNNQVIGNYAISPVAVWPDYNLCDAIVYDSIGLTHLATNLANFPQYSPFVTIYYYDGTYYYLCLVDLRNKVIRKVQIA